MKLKIVAVVVTGLLAANVAHAAEVYNKDGNKLDLYGKVTALRYFTDDKRDDGDKTYARLGFKGETHINDQRIGFPSPSPSCSRWADPQSFVIPPSPLLKTYALLTATPPYTEQLEI